MAKILLNFRVEREEYSAVKKRAELENKTLSDYLRDNLIEKLSIKKNFKKI
jgi:uncharacterized protein (DUF1778 family)